MGILHITGLIGKIIFLGGIKGGSNREEDNVDVGHFRCDNVLLYPAIDNQLRGV